MVGLLEFGPDARTVSGTASSTTYSPPRKAFDSGTHFRRHRPQPVQHLREVWARNSERAGQGGFSPLLRVKELDQGGKFLRFHAPIFAQAKVKNKHMRN